MADSSSVDDILEFLRRNKFTKAEAALRTELGNRPDLNGILQKLKLDDKELGSSSSEEANGAKVLEEDQKLKSSRNSGECLKDSSTAEASKELIVKEVECGTGRNGAENKWKSRGTIGEQSMVDASVGTSDKNFTFSKSSDDTVLDLYSWKYSTGNGPVPSYKNDDGSVDENNFVGFQVSSKTRLNSAEALNSSKVNLKPGEDVNFSGEKRMTWPGTISMVGAEPEHERSEKSEVKEVDQKRKAIGACSKNDLADDPWSRSNVSAPSASELWKDCSVKTVFPFSVGDTSTSYDSAAAIIDKKEGKRKTEFNDIRAAIKNQVDEVGRALYFGKTQGGEPKDLGALEFHLASDNQKEDFPRLPPVKLKSEDKPFNIQWEEKYERDGPGPKILNSDNSYLMGSFLDVPIGREINPSGKRPAGGSWLSVSQGIAEDTSDLVSGFATIGDGLSESIDYPNEYWDSDEYEDDDDIGYTRQPIEDETWFLAHEIDYPSDNEKGTGNGSVPDPQEREQNKEDEDDQSFAEEDSYFSGERYFQSKNIDPAVSSDNPVGLSATEMYRRNSENPVIGQYDGQLMDEEELNLMRAEPVWQGFVPQSNELIMLGNGKVMSECGRPRLDDICMDDDQHGSVRSIGVGINSDAADIGSEVRESLIGGSSEGDVEYFHDHDASIGGSRHDLYKNSGERSRDDKNMTKRQNSDKYIMSNDKGSYTQAKNHIDGGFSFPPPRDGQLVKANSSKSLWSNKVNTIVSDEADDRVLENDDVLTSWRRKSSDSSPIRSSRDDKYANAGESANSSPSSLSNYGYTEREHLKKEEDVKAAGIREEDPGPSLEDEEAAAVQEQVKQIKAQEEEFETFNLKIVHRKNRTGFEEDKNFHVVLNSVIAGRYHVTEYLGSAAFSKAIQAHDLHTGMDVCVKIIKNNKDFFDQSLDEIKLLKYVNKHDPADKYHLLRLYDYFYYREHLLIVCELLKANLYEFHKFNRESGGEVYFTMPRLQSITIQCLEALQFLHSLGLIHCDLKPENILVKSYSRCEVKVIDLGSSCFETDHLCSYVQSRSYRAPEVILGLPYDKKIDIWSLGCILAELCTGNVLFQNDSPATLLARVIGIISPIEQEMLAKGRDTYKYFTKNHMLYERNQETNRLEYLIPKKSSLRHRLPMGDQGFIDFVGHLLEINPKKRPSASEALKHPWLQYPYEPISS
ncbi:putative serine/threonine-protein kinase dyrk2 [Sesamum alatum]|uniref:Serine/threonine-protein kinase dyrk2 n=1 Tax=Sesamum alatum TaxID=300844 RepID=A0AAE1YBF6_9LAMI|nr:putative serine/threonine-protein kinase dyrk2 [Sesamum alatum]